MLRAFLSRSEENQFKDHVAEPTAEGARPRRPGIPLGSQGALQSTAGHRPGLELVTKSRDLGAHGPTTGYSALSPVPSLFADLTLAGAGSSHCRKGNQQPALPRTTEGCTAPALPHTSNLCHGAYRVPLTQRSSGENSWRAQRSPFVRAPADRSGPECSLYT